MTSRLSHKKNKHKIPCRHLAAGKGPLPQEPAPLHVIISTDVTTRGATHDDAVVGTGERRPVFGGLAAVLALSSGQLLHSCTVMELVCGSMMDPGSDLQTSPPPYSIELSKYTAAPGDIVTVTLKAPTVAFKGVFAQGRRDNTGADHTAVGTFAVTSAKPEVELCNCKPGRHNAALYIKPLHPLHEIVVSYTVPANETKIFIRSSMSLDQNTFWHVNSEPLLVK